MNKRIGSLLLALMMLLSLFPASALAEGETVMDAYTPEPEYVEGPPTEITEEPAVIEEPAEEPAGDETDPQGPQPDVPEEPVEEPAVVEEPEPIEEPAVVEEPTEDPVGDDALGVPEEPIEKPEEVLEEEAPDAKTESDEAALASSGSCGENVNWTLDGDTLTITGTGAIADFSDFNNPGWYSSRMDVKNIVIGSGVTRIGAYAFYQMGYTRSITIPSTVTAIGMHAFHGCSLLRTLQLPGGLQTIGSNGFMNCALLASIEIPASVTVIGGLAFSGCSGLKTVCFLGSAPTIHPDVFSGVTATVYYPGSDASWSSVAGQNYGGALTWKQGGQCGDSVYWELNGGVLTISGSGAMWDDNQPWGSYKDSITSIVIEDGVTSVGAYAFYGCWAASSVTIPESVTAIKTFAFHGCGLTSVTIPSGVTSIPYATFANCSKLTSITIPAGVTSIGAGAFMFCTGLTSIQVASGNPNYVSVDGVLFNADKKTLHTFPAGRTGRYTVPSGVTAIGDRAFLGGSLTSVTIPYGVTSIGSNAFDQCGSLTSVTIPNSVTSISSFAFYYTALTSITIPSSVEFINTAAFGYCKSLTSVTIPASVKGIFERAFQNCTSLKDVYFQGDKPGISSSKSFENVTATVYYPPLESWGTPTAQYGGTLTWVCNNKCGDNVTWALSSDGVLTISGTGPMWDYMSEDPGWYPLRESISSAVIGSGVTSIGVSAFNSIHSLTSVTIPDSVTSIGNCAFYSCEALASATIPAGVTSIGKDAFEYCSSLTSVTIPAGVTIIEEYSFGYCSSLTSVTIPGGVTSIKNRAFYHCKALTSVTIQEGVKEIGYAAFDSCSSLTSVTIPESVTSIADYSFNGCTALTSVTIPAGVTSIGWNAFSVCYSLTSVTISEGVKSIGLNTFYLCTGLTSVTIPASVTIIDGKAFAYCSSLTTITFRGNAPTIYTDAFKDVTATAYYPGDDASWTDSVKQNYGGTITWVAMALALEPNKLSLPVTETAQLKASGYLSDLKWTSSSEKTATVDQNGLVKANKYGKATITVTVPGTDLSASCEVQTLFWDVADPSQYYFKHVYWAAEAGITNGYDLEYFGPQLECTREQMMTFLWRMAGKPEPTTTKNPFPDVPSSAYYHKAVLWGVEKGITNGFSSGEYAGKFGVGLPCTREQAMTFLWRMAGKPNPSSSTNPFADIKSSDYYYKAVLWASQNGIANGYTSGEYAGKYGVGLACLREHMVTFLSRYNSKFG